MEIKRIEQIDARFSKKAIQTHMAFCVENNCIEFELLDKHTALIKYNSLTYLEEVMDEMHFYAGHVTKIIDEKGTILKTYPCVQLFTIPLKDIQPSQFYVSQSKLEKLQNALTIEHICIPVARIKDQWVCLDGHTRLKYLETQHIPTVQVYEEEAFPYLDEFVAEAIKRHITSIADCALLSEEEYALKWHAFCDAFFKAKERKTCN